ncbi:MULTISPECIES: DUF3991 domain-containing protein [Vagococcus]|uniref:LtrC-like protein n=1 Tax=Vagococcus fluvialis bH819 TaxID=1255619 RepID=A0A1X6WTW7_9ENTE|nr:MULTISPECIES: DUF3991 domain-containing protein [Vagococcus]SLM87066.1 LtrC-like protein [Vagococcus fluvialis bH819]HCM90588.1 DUF3991 domain-containing protein [Vagococcus sp.]
MATLVDKLKKINIVDFCEENGINIKQDSKDYFRLVENDSCVVNQRKNVFSWNSRSKSGDIIDFVQAYYECDFKEAKQKLLEKEYEPHVYVEREKKDFAYDSTKERPVNEARNYLVNERNINPKIVDPLVEKGLIRQDDRKNVLFCWADSEKIVGVTEQGTSKFFDKKSEEMKSWKKIQADGKEDFGFNVKVGKPDNVYFFESEIDKLSYMTLYPQKMNNAHFISMNGVKPQTVVNVLNENYSQTGEIPKSVTICTDNDKAGRNFFDEYFKDKGIGVRGTENYVEFKKDLPKKEGADWNDVLRTKIKSKVMSLSKKDLSMIIPKNINEAPKKQLEMS